MNQQKALDLINEINKKKESWNEIDQFSLKGVQNLSTSDLDTLELYATAVLHTGTWKGTLMSPLGDIEKVLAKYDLL